MRTLVLSGMAVLIGMASGLAQAAPWQFDDSHTRVGFTVDHMGFSTVHGQFGSFKGMVDYDEKKPKSMTVDFTIDTKSINTGWEARDEHLQKPEFFNVEKFPTMQFKSTGVMMMGKDKAHVSGNLTLLGVTKPVVLHVTLNKHAVSPITKKDTIGFVATTTVKRSDFGMMAYVPAVGDEIPVRIDAEMSPAESTESVK